MKSFRRPKAEKINWQQVRERLGRAVQATGEAHRPSPEKARAILEERAHRLARPPEEDRESAGTIEVVVFSLGEERYALETRHVREVVPLRDITPLPGAPAFLGGVINLRGHILAVFDLRPFFGLAARGLTDLTRVIVLGDERAELGVLAGTASEVTALRPEDVQEPPPTVAGVAREYLRGVTREALIILDGAVLLQDPRLVIDQSEETGAP